MQNSAQVDAPKTEDKTEKKRIPPLPDKTSTRYYFYAQVSFNDRQLAVKLGRALWDQGYDYTHERFCPFLPNHQAATDVKGPRPEWGLFAR